MGELKDKRQSSERRQCQPHSKEVRRCEDQNRGRERLGLDVAQGPWEEGQGRRAFGRRHWQCVKEFESGASSREAFYRRFALH